VSGREVLFGEGKKGESVMRYRVVASVKSSNRRSLNVVGIVKS
jgi:hypothetical protein